MTTIDSADPRCPECGEPIGATATYCMHCSADLTDARQRADTDDDGYWDEQSPSGNVFLRPDGPVDDTLTLIVGIVGGLIIGVLGAIVLQFVAPAAVGFGLGTVIWLGATVHLIRRETVHETVARSAYGIALILLTVPFTVFGPASANSTLGSRVVIFLILLGGMIIPAGILAAVGYFVARLANGTAEDRGSL